MDLIDAQRILLRPIVESDYTLLRHLDKDPKVLEFIGPAFPESHTLSRMEKIKKRINDGSGLGYWMGEIKETNEPIGWFVLLTY